MAWVHGMSTEMSIYGKLRDVRGIALQRSCTRLALPVRKYAFETTWEVVREFFNAASRLDAVALFSAPGFSASPSALDLSQAYSREGIDQQTVRLRSS